MNKAVAIKYLIGFTIAVTGAGVILSIWASSNKESTDSEAFQAVWDERTKKRLKALTNVFMAVESGEAKKMANFIVGDSQKAFGFYFDKGTKNFKREDYVIKEVNSWCDSLRDSGGLTKLNKEEICQL